MDIHRSRFVPYPASPINALAFSRTNDRDLPEPKPALRLAIGRADGSIEIWNPDRANWVQESVIPGNEEISVEGLAWTQDPNETLSDGTVLTGQLRLFSIGSKAAVWEWDLETSRPKRVSTGNFSEVWCIASQPRIRSGYVPKEGEWTGQDLALGCADGTVVVLSTAEDDLTFKRFLARGGTKKTRCMSVIWQGRDRIVAGFSDSTMRVYDARNGLILRTMSLGVGQAGAPKNVLVWRMKTLPDGNLISADSNGEIVVWNGITYSMKQKISSHDCDCLDLITSADGKMIVSGGIDGKIANFQINEKDGQKRKWAKLSHRRMHQGDIKSMAVYDGDDMSVFVTGGTDTKPSVIPLRQFSRENHIRLSSLPQRQPLVSAPLSRLVVSWWDRSVRIWRIGDQITGLPSDPASRKLVGMIKIDSKDSIWNVSVSNDGRLLAIATSRDTRLFQMRTSSHGISEKIRFRAISLPADVTKTGSRHVLLSPDSRWLVLVSNDSDVSVLRITSSDENPKYLAIVPQAAELERIRRRNDTKSGLGRYERCINQIAFSADSRLVCVSDLSGYIDVFSLSGELDPTAAASERIQPVKTQGGRPAPRRPSTPQSDSDTSSDEDEDELPLSFYGQTWTLHPSTVRLPKLDSQALVMTFHPEPALSDHLFLVTQHHQIHELDTTKARLSTWSRRNPSAVLPPELTTMKERVVGAIWDYHNQGPHDAADRSATSTHSPRQARLWLYGHTWLAMLDVSQDFALPPTSGRHRRRRDGLGVSGNVRDEDDDDDDDDHDDGNDGQGREQKAVVVVGEKRKRNVAWQAEKWAFYMGARKKRRGRGGAGDEKPEAERRGEAAVVNNDDDDDDGEEEEEDRMKEEEGLALVRRDDDSSDDGDDGQGRKLEQQQRQEGEQEEGEEEEEEEEGDSRRRIWWCTYKYQPILGIVPLSKKPAAAAAMVSGGVDGDASGNGGAREPIEVCLVERPVWDLEHMRT